MHVRPADLYEELGGRQCVGGLRGGGGVELQVPLRIGGPGGGGRQQVPQRVQVRQLQPQSLAVLDRLRHVAQLRGLRALHQPKGPAGREMNGVHILSREQMGKVELFL